MSKWLNLLTSGANSFRTAIKRLSWRGICPGAIRHECKKVSKQVSPQDTVFDYFLRIT